MFAIYRHDERAEIPQRQEGNAFGSRGEAQDWLDELISKQFKTPRLRNHRGALTEGWEIREEDDPPPDELPSEEHHAEVVHESPVEAALDESPVEHEDPIHDEPA